jgi:hypothetical protein
MNSILGGCSVYSLDPDIFFSTVIVEMSVSRFETMQGILFIPGSTCVHSYRGSMVAS